MNKSGVGLVHSFIRIPKPSMAHTWPAASSILLSLLLLTITASLVHADPHLCQAADQPAPQKCEDHPSTLALADELQRSKDQLHDLERRFSEKDLGLLEKEKAIVSLQAELDKLKDEQGGELEASLKSAQIELKNLESKVNHLDGELQKKELELHDFKDRIKMLELAEAERSSTIKELNKLVSEQKESIKMAEHALRAAEATLLKVQAEADVKEQELNKVHGGWLPPWTSNRITELQTSTAEYWTRYAEPVLNIAIKEASEKLAAVQELSKPHVSVMKTRWNHLSKQSLETVSAIIAPHVETAKCRVAEGYQASMDFLSPHLNKLQEGSQPYLQVAKERCRPYLEQVAGLVGPHLQQVQAVTRPYTEKVFQSYRDFLTTATTYHSQLQVSVEENLKKVDVLAPLASKELVWFLASALLALPAMAIVFFFSAAFGSSKKPVKAAKGHGGHGHKKAKRARQADK